MRIEELQDRIRELQGDNIAPPEFVRLTGRELQLFRLLLARQMVSLETAMTVLYSDRENPPLRNILSIFVHRLRTKLKPHGVAIETIWGGGYRMKAAAKARVRELMKL